MIFTNKNKIKELKTEKDFTIINAKVYTGLNWTTENLLFENFKFIKFSKTETIGKIFNFKDKVICPAFIDLHTHVRDFEDKESETVNSLAESALYGGYQTICTMANSKPILDNVEKIKKLLKKCKKEDYIEILNLSALTKNFKDKELVDIEKLNNYVVGYSDDGFFNKNKELLDEAMHKLRFTNKFIALHLQRNKKTCLLDVNVAKKHLNYSNKNIGAWKNFFEYDNYIWLLNTIKSNPYSKIHFCHVATDRIISSIRMNCLRTKNFSAEIAPHHLIFDSSIIKKNNLSDWKVNPPIFDLSNKNELMEIIEDSDIFSIASDHAPHKNKVQNDFNDSKPGFTWISFLFTVLYTILVVNQKVLSLENLIRALSFRPARLLEKDIKLKKHKSWNFIVIDLEEDIKDLNAINLSKSNNNPLLYIKNEWFSDLKYKGKIKYSFTNKRIFEFN